MATINMQTMRFINLLDRISRVKTRRCFIYNNVIVFAVPGYLMSRAIGPNGKNVRIIQEQLGRRVKIVREPQGIEDASQFIRDVVEPLSFRSLEIQDSEMIIAAGSRYKAALLGRDKIRWHELSRITEDFFQKSVRII